MVDKSGFYPMVLVGNVTLLKASVNAEKDGRFLIRAQMDLGFDEEDLQPVEVDAPAGQVTFVTSLGD